MNENIYQKKFHIPIIRERSRNCGSAVLEEENRLFHKEMELIKQELIDFSHKHALQSKVKKREWGRTEDEVNTSETLHQNQEKLRNDFLQFRLPDREADYLGDEKVEIRFFISDYKPEEINVKLVDNQQLIIDAKHEESSERNVSELVQLHREVSLPLCIDIDVLDCVTFQNGYLNITANVVNGKNI